MRQPEDWTPEEQERFLRAIFDPSGAWGLKPDEPLPLKTRLYQAGYLDGVGTAARVVEEMTRMRKDATREGTKVALATLAAWVLAVVENGTAEEDLPTVVEVAYANDEQALNAVLAAGAPEWNEHLGDKYRDGHSAGFWDFFEERFFKIREENA